MLATKGLHWHCQIKCTPFIGVRPSYQGIISQSSSPIQTGTPKNYMKCINLLGATKRNMVCNTQISNLYRWNIMYLLSIDKNRCNISNNVLQHLKPRKTNPGIFKMAKCSPRWSLLYLINIREPAWCRDLWSTGVAMLVRSACSHALRL